MQIYVHKIRLLSLTDGFCLISAWIQSFHLAQTLSHMAMAVGGRYSRNNTLNRSAGNSSNMF